MDANNRRTFLIIIALLITALACSVPGAAAERIDPTSMVQTVIAQITVDYALTRVAGDTAGGASSEATTEPENAAVPENTSTPEGTATLTPSATLELTEESSVPIIGVTTNTNCRKGPGDAYEATGALVVGETAEVLGRESSNNFYYIDKGCWVWNNYAVLQSGSLDNLPIMTAPSTPTPEPGPWDGDWVVAGTDWFDGPLTFNQADNSINGVFDVFIFGNPDNPLTILLNGTVDDSGRAATGTYAKVLPGGNEIILGTFFLKMNADLSTWSGRLIANDGAAPVALCAARPGELLPCNP